MTRRIVVLSEARMEMVEAQIWYTGRASGLGERFLASVEAALLRIGGAPQQLPVVFGSTRRVLVRRFPYAIYFRVEPEAVVIMACMHTSRDPERWRRRT